MQRECKGFFKLHKCLSNPNLRPILEPDHEIACINRDAVHEGIPGMLIKSGDEVYLLAQVIHEAADSGAFDDALPALGCKAFAPGFFGLVALPQGGVAEPVVGLVNQQPTSYIFTTKYEATPMNWLMFILLFGWIWMWF